jgi:hypothetical protein
MTRHCAGAIGLRDAYLALAEAAGATLVSCDAALGAAPGRSADVIVVV